jgi:LacI family transcriptional regulator
MTRPTIKTIAQETGLSIATVSKALNRSPQVRPETRALVVAAAERIGYELNMHGVQLRTGMTYQIAAVIPSPAPKQNEWESNHYFQLLAGVSRSLKWTPYRVSIYSVKNFEESLTTIRQIVSLKQADGVILSNTHADDPRVRCMQEADFPFVTYGTTVYNEAHSYVGADGDKMVSNSVARLTERGHRRIALLNPAAELSSAFTRLEAYRRALETAGLTFDPDLERVL